MDSVIQGVASALAVVIAAVLGWRQGQRDARRRMAGTTSRKKYTTFHNVSISHLRIYLLEKVREDQQ